MRRSSPRAVTTRFHSSASWARWTSRNARRRDPNRARIASPLGSSSSSGARPLLFEELDEGVQQLLVVLDGGLNRGEELAAAAPVSACKERHPIRDFTKDVEDAGPRGHRRLGQLALDPVLELRLLVELLERRDRRHEAVPVRRNRIELGRFRREASGHDEGAFGVRPRTLKALGPLLGILNHVDHVPDIHNLRRREVSLGRVCRIPSVCLDAAEAEMADVITSTAAEVEDGGSWADQTVGQCNLDRS